MKRLVYSISFVLLALLSGACNDDFSDNQVPSLSPHYIYASDREFSFSNVGGTSVFRVEAYNSGWSFTGTPAWIALNPSGGSQSQDVTLDVGANPSDVARTGIFYLSSSDAAWQFDMPFTVTQKASAPWLIVADHEVDFGGAGGEKIVNIEANCGWYASCSQSWISLFTDPEAGVLGITALPNPSDTYRSATVYITYGPNGFETVNVSQSPSSVLSSDYTLTFENGASSCGITISSETPWTSRVSDSWISMSPRSGEAGSVSATIEVAPNLYETAREGFVAVMTEGSERLQIKIVQNGLNLESDPSSIEFSAREESAPLHIVCNASWRVAEKPEWLSLSKEEGSGEAQITLTVSPNPSINVRSGRIAIEVPGTRVRTFVEVQQKGLSLTPGDKILEFTDAGGSQSFHLTADADWNSSCSDSWFDASPSSGSGDTRIEVTVQENKSDVERTGTISYNCLGRVENVNVHQQAKFLSVGDGAIDFAWSGGSHSVEISTGDSWQVSMEANPEWLSVSAASGTGSASIILTAKENQTVSSRRADLIISTDYSQPVRLIVSQRPRTLSVSATGIFIFSTGGNSDPVAVYADGPYAVKANDGWLAVNRGEGNTFTVYAAENPDTQMRRGSVTVSLTGLLEGAVFLDIPVVQAGEGGSFVIDGFPQDSDWDTVGSGSLSVTIRGFESDTNWNSSSENNLHITISGYDNDKNWN